MLEATLSKNKNSPYCIWNSEVYQYQQHTYWPRKWQALVQSMLLIHPSSSVFSWFSRWQEKGERNWKWGKMRELFCIQLRAIPAWIEELFPFSPSHSLLSRTLSRLLSLILCPFESSRFFPSRYIFHFLFSRYIKLKYQHHGFRFVYIVLCLRPSA